jgi:hypothetical protein
VSYEKSEKKFSKRFFYLPDSAYLWFIKNMILMEQMTQKLKKVATGKLLERHANAQGDELKAIELILRKRKVDFLPVLSAEDVGYEEVVIEQTEAEVDAALLPAEIEGQKLCQAIFAANEEAKALSKSLHAEIEVTEENAKEVAEMVNEVEQRLEALSTKELYASLNANLAEGKTSYLRQMKRDALADIKEVKPALKDAAERIKTLRKMAKAVTKKEPKEKGPRIGKKAVSDTLRLDADLSAVKVVRKYTAEDRAAAIEEALQLTNSLKGKKVSFTPAGFETALVGVVMRVTIDPRKNYVYIIVKDENGKSYHKRAATAKIEVLDNVDPIDQAVETPAAEVPAAEVPAAEETMAEETMAEEALVAENN